MSLVHPPRWTAAEFDEQRNEARQIFRDQRLSESQGAYAQAFAECLGFVRMLLAETDDLSRIEAEIDGSVSETTLLEALTNPDMLETLRYVAGPPVSADDLAELSDTSLAPGVLREEPESARRVAETIARGLDPKRFPWVSEQRRASDGERTAAAVATAALMATRRVETARRMQSKDQEESVRACLRDAGMVEVETRPVTPGLLDAPAPGEFCGEALFGQRKADLVVRLHDGRCMPIECKVSNSSTNSVKRLNNDAAAKASAWIEEFGSGATVPCAVLSGIFKTHNLEQAQEQNLTIFWAHNLDPLVAFIHSTRQSD
ncbi:MAG: XamI family restriction endonuclease [Acidimicrobiia bacterium]|nr:XamI family restriction endonuclease [Acidimicrobiia bacterium]